MAQSMERTRESVSLELRPLASHGVHQGPRGKDDDHHQQQDVEEQQQQQQHQSEEEEEDRPGHTFEALPPTDQGPGAWKFIFGCFLIEAILWGFPVAFGVFQDYYTSLPQFRNDAGNIPVIGTVATSIFYLGAPVAAPLVKRYYNYKRSMIAVGAFTCALSLLLASFADGSVAGLIATQGAAYGSGFLVLYVPMLFMINEWFVRRRGLAYGVLYAGGGFSGVGLPFLLEWLLSTYGHRTTLRAVAVAQFVLVLPTLFLLKGRLPPSHHNVMQRVDLRFFKHPLFWVFTISNLCQGMAFYIPPLFLPSFASLVGLSGTVGALILAANNLATVGGQVLFGYLSDRFNIFVLIFASTFVSCVACLTLWGLGHSLETLLIFALIYGCFAGSYVVFWPKFGTMVSEDPQSVFSLMAFGKGIGNIVTGPVASSLMYKPVSSGYGMGKYQPVIIFMGTMLFCSSLGAFGWPLKKLSPR